MDKKAKELRREYMRKWRQANKEKVRQYRETYWQRKAFKEEVNNNAANTNVGA